GLLSLAAVGLLGAWRMVHFVEQPVLPLTLTDSAALAAVQAAATLSAWRTLRRAGAGKRTRTVLLLSCLLTAAGGLCFYTVTPGSGSNVLGIVYADRLFALGAAQVTALHGALCAWVRGR
ncbi:MAG: hypothetical protein IJC43_00195, partial [Clostridia bacterium]|nr:hypothetical protein [Clostridia bacterium]